MEFDVKMRQEQSILGKALVLCMLGREQHFHSSVFGSYFLYVYF